MSILSPRPRSVCSLVYEQDSLVKRVAYPTIPPKVEYSLTPLGRTLTEPLAALHVWSEAHVEEIEAARKAHVTV